MSDARPTKTVLLRNYYERDLLVDDVTGEATIPIRVRRFTKDQLAAFQLGWSRCENPPSERAIYRKVDTDEQARAERGYYLVPETEIRRRRLQEMTPDELTAFMAQEAEDVAFIATFCDEQIRQHVWLDPKAHVSVEDDNGATRTVTTGPDLADLFAGNLAMLTRLARVIYEENTLAPEQKKTLRQLSASTRGSSETPSGAGPTPVATATSADPQGSATSEPATDPPGQSPSTETA